VKAHQAALRRALVVLNQAQVPVQNHLALVAQSRVQALALNQVAPLEVLVPVPQNLQAPLNLLPQAHLKVLVLVLQNLLLAQVQSLQVPVHQKVQVHRNLAQVLVLSLLPVQVQKVHQVQAPNLQVLQNLPVHLKAHQAVPQNLPAPLNHPALQNQAQVQVLLPPALFIVPDNLVGIGREKLALMVQIIGEQDTILMLMKYNLNGLLLVTWAVIIGQRMLMQQSIVVVLMLVH